MKENKIKLTAKEEEAMLLLWKKGPMFVRELLKHYSDPKPHFNTLSTVVRGLEEKGYVSHIQYGGTHQYYAVLTIEEYRAQSLKKLIGNYFDNSIFSAVSALVTSKSLSSEEVNDLLKMVNQQEQKGE